jgi:homoserine O-acetyltransferase
MPRNSRKRCASSIVCAASQCVTSYAQTSHWPTQDGNYVIKNFHFGSGESIPELKLHYLTLGKPHRDAAGHTDNVVLLLHGTGGDAHSLLNPVFSDVLFGPGQPLDITKFYIILPDDIGHGESSKPSDGCACISLSTTTTTWLPPSTPCWLTASTSIICG